MAILLDEAKEKYYSTYPDKRPKTDKSGSKSKYAAGDLFTLGDGSMWFHGDTSEDLDTNGRIARGVDPDTITILPHALVLQNPNGGIGGTESTGAEGLVDGKQELKVET